MTESAPSWGLGIRIDSRLCRQLAVGDWTSHFSSPSLSFLIAPQEPALCITKASQFLSPGLAMPGGDLRPQFPRLQ